MNAAVGEGSKCAAECAAGFVVKADGGKNHVTQTPAKTFLGKKGTIPVILQIHTSSCKEHGEAVTIQGFECVQIENIFKTQQPIDGLSRTSLAIGIMLMLE